eukprot:6189875-Pleurochrysis_carterae.AAC.1
MPAVADIITRSVPLLFMFVIPWAPASERLTIARACAPVLECVLTNARPRAYASLRPTAFSFTPSFPRWCMLTSSLVRALASGYPRASNHVQAPASELVFPRPCARAGAPMLACRRQCLFPYAPCARALNPASDRTRVGGCAYLYARNRAMEIGRARVCVPSDTLSSTPARTIARDPPSLIPRAGSGALVLVSVRASTGIRKRARHPTLNAFTWGFLSR